MYERWARWPLRCPECERISIIALIVPLRVSVQFMGHTKHLWPHRKESKAGWENYDILRGWCFFFLATSLWPQFKVIAYLSITPRWGRGEPSKEGSKHVTLSFCPPPSPSACLKFVFAAFYEKFGDDVALLRTSIWRRGMVAKFLTVSRVSKGRGYYCLLVMYNIKQYYFNVDTATWKASIHSRTFSDWNFWGADCLFR